MRILVISSVLPPFQAAEADYAWQFCRRLAERGHEVTVLTNRRELAPPPGVTVRAVMGKWSVFALPRLWRELKRADPEGVALLYIGWMYDRLPLATFLPTITRWCRPRARFTTIFYNRYGADPKRARLGNVVLHKLLKATTGERGLIYEYGTLFTESHRVFAFSGQHAEVYRTVWPPVARRLEVLPALPLIRFSQRPPDDARKAGRMRLGAADTEFLLVFLGYVYPSKGLETLIAALPYLPSRFRLAIVGGELDRAIDFKDYAGGLRGEVAARGLQSRVHWAGAFAWDSESASELLSAADCIVLPFDEGVSLNNSSFATAAWHARPIVSTFRKDTEAEFHDGENIVLVPPKNPHALAQAIARIAEDRELARRLGRGARRLAEARLSWESALTQVTDALAGAAVIPPIPVAGEKAR